MKLFDKIKDIFTEEEEVISEEPIKKEVIKVEIPAPEATPKRSTPEVSIPKEEVKKEEKMTFPVFDDTDFNQKDYADAEEKKEEVKPVATPTYARTTAYKEKKNPSVVKTVYKEEKKEFKPSPIISPVYGILDKNYQKEDIKNKKRKPTDIRREPRVLTVDDVRKRAFATLEDDLEEELLNVTEVNEFENKQHNEVFDEMEKNSFTTVDDDTDFSAKDDTITDIDIEEEKLSIAERIKRLDLDKKYGHLMNEENKENDIEITIDNDDEDSDENDIDMDLDINKLIGRSSLKGTKNDKEKETKVKLRNKYDEDSDDKEDDLKKKTSIKEEERTKNNNDDIDDDDEGMLTENDLFNLIDSMYEKGEE